MFGSGLMEIAIGMVFVYLLLSLLCTVLNEWISGLLGMRARNLEEGIRSLFTDGALRAASNGATAESLADALYDHGLIQSLYRSTWINKLQGRPGRPSYIPARTFAVALLDILAPANADGSESLTAVRAAAWRLPDSKGKQALLAILGQVQGGLEEARDAIENWYNDGMDRVSGWYKRKSQMVLIVLAIIVTVISNTDSILVARTFWNSPTLRASAVAAADDYVQGGGQRGSPGLQGAASLSAGPQDAPQLTPGVTQQPHLPAERALDDQVPTGKRPGGDAADIATRVGEITNQLGGLQLPIGWPLKYPGKEGAAPGRAAYNGSANASAPIVPDLRAFPNDPKAQMFRILGWFTTAIAVSLGAPFWFDVLNKFMVVRNTVKPREKSQVEQSKDS